MKKNFFSGCLCGISIAIITIIAVSYLFYSTTDEKETFTKSKIIKLKEDTSELKIFQTLENDFALSLDHSDNIIAVYEEGAGFYDGEKLTLNAGYGFYIIGTYKYTTKKNGSKTVPVVKRMKIKGWRPGRKIKKKNGVANKIKKNKKITSLGAYPKAKVYKVKDGYAFARQAEDKYHANTDLYYGTKIVVCPRENPFYEEQKITPVNGKYFQIIGIYNDGYSVLPVVK